MRLDTNAQAASKEAIATGLVPAGGKNVVPLPVGSTRLMAARHVSQPSHKPPPPPTGAPPPPAPKVAPPPAPAADAAKQVGAPPPALAPRPPSPPPRFHFIGGAAGGPVCPKRKNSDRLHPTASHSARSILSVTCFVAQAVDVGDAAAAEAAEVLASGGGDKGPSRKRKAVNPAKAPSANSLATATATASVLEPAPAPPLDEPAAKRAAPAKE